MTRRLLVFILVLSLTADALRGAGSGLFLDHPASNPAKGSLTTEALSMPSCARFFGGVHEGYGYSAKLKAYRHSGSSSPVQSHLVGEEINGLVRHSALQFLLRENKDHRVRTVGWSWEKRRPSFFRDSGEISDSLNFQEFAAVLTPLVLPLKLGRQVRIAVIPENELVTLPGKRADELVPCWIQWLPYKEALKKERAENHNGADLVPVLFIRQETYEKLLQNDVFAQAATSHEFAHLAWSAPNGLARILSADTVSVKHFVKQSLGAFRKRLPRLRTAYRAQEFYALTRGDFRRWLLAYLAQPKGLKKSPVDFVLPGDHFVYARTLRWAVERALQNPLIHLFPRYRTSGVFFWFLMKTSPLVMRRLRRITDRLSDAYIDSMLGLKVQAHPAGQTDEEDDVDPEQGARAQNGDDRVKYIDLLKIYAPDERLRNVPKEQAADRTLEIFREVLMTGWIAGKREEIVGLNARLVISIVRRYQGRGMSKEDLVQEGMIGLLRAIEKFEVHKGYQFTTYATHWIRQAVTRAIANQSREIRLPAHVHDFLARYHRIINRVVEEIGREPPLEWVAKEMEVTEKKLMAILVVAQEPLSLDMPMGKPGSHNEMTLGGVIEAPDNFVDDLINRLGRSELQGVLCQIWQRLTPREKDVMTFRLGYDPDTGEDLELHTLQEIGDIFHVSRERIRQIEIQALKKLRQPASPVNSRRARRSAA